MDNTVASVIAGALLFLLCDVARSIAPGDEDLLCTREARYAQPHPATQRIILDSYNYHNLLYGVWQRLDGDGRGEGWTEGQSEICRNAVHVCDFRDGPHQDNWLFTQYISYPSSSSYEVFVRITYDFSRCRSDPMCNVSYFNVLIYHANSSNLQEQTKSSNYNILERIEQPLVDDETTTTVSFQRSSSDGLYLALQDVGSCGTLFRLQVYYELCPGKVVRLVIYPSLPLPGRNSAFASEGTAVCAPNARNTSLLEFKAYSDGECERTVVCECVPGYVEEQVLLPGTDLLVSQCKACGPGMYRSNLDSSCKVCPLNSKSLLATAVECPCLSGYFRARGEGASAACTAPPGGCGLVNVLLATATAITLTWDKPELTGREDFYYTVYYEQLSIMSGNTTGPYVNTSGRVAYTISGLQPSTEYLFRVTVHNGVSDQDVDSEEARSCDTLASTADIGQPLNVSGFCRIVTWHQPQLDGANGYVVRLFVPGTNREVIVQRQAREPYHTVQDAESFDEMYFVQVRFVVGGVYGLWSEAVPLGCSNIVPVMPRRAPVTPLVHYARSGYIIWSTTDSQPSDSDSTFEIRYSQSGSQSFETVSTNITLLAYTLSNLDLDTRYTIQVREIVDDATGNWSLPFSFQTTASRLLTIIEHPRSYTVEAGDTVNLTCTARGANPLSFIWGTTAAISSAGLPASSESKNPDSSVTSTLSITSAGKDFTGEYLCIIMDSTGSRLLSVPANISVLSGDTDMPSVRIRFTQQSYTVNESDESVTVGIIKRGNVTQPFTIHLVGGTNATMNVVHSVEAVDRTLTFNNQSQDSLDVIIPLIVDMVALETVEKLYLRMELVSPVSEDVELVEPTLAVVSIFDNALVSVGFKLSNVSVLEGVGSLFVCLNKSTETAIPLAVRLESQSVTASNTTDYSIPQGLVEITFGETDSQKCFGLQITDDVEQEVDESFQLHITSLSPSDPRILVSQAFTTITIVDDDIVSGLRFSLRGRTYPNNSIVSLWDVGENEGALLCQTDLTQCCSTPPHRHGEFFYPNGERVLTFGGGGDFYRNRGLQVIRLNRKPGTTSPTGRFRCQLPDASGITQDVFINISQTIITFEETSYTFTESIGVGEVCLVRSGYIDGTNDVRITGALQEETGETVDEVVSFLATETRKCLDIAVVDDTIALERTEELTFRLASVGSPRYELGDEQTAVVQVIDDDELSLSLEKVANVSEAVGVVEVCVQFSDQFVEPFNIHLNTSAPESSAFAEPGVDFTLPGPLTVNGEHSRRGGACLNITIIDDIIAEAEECLLVTVVATKPVAPVSVSFCIKDNDDIQVSFQRSTYMFLESQEAVDVCVEKLGPTRETIQVNVSGDLQRESGETLKETLTFTPSSTIQCFSFAIIDDSIALEEPEYLTFTLSTPSDQGYSLGQYRKASVGIIDDDELVVSLVNTSNFTEGKRSAELCLTFSTLFASSFNIRLSTIVSPNISIPHRATPDIDYAALPLVVSPTTEANRTGRMCISFAIFDDDIIEPDECIAISISVSSDAVITADNGTTTVLCITDNDQDVVIGFSHRNYSVAEDSGEVWLSISVLSGDVKRPTSVFLSTRSGTALSPNDYNTVANSELNFAPGVTEVSVSIPIVNDTVFEESETFSATLSSETAGVTLAPNETLILINDDDVVIGFVSTSYTVAESGGQVLLTVAVVDGTLTRPIGFSVFTSDGSARGVTDYIRITSSLGQLDPAHLSSVIAVVIVDDDIEEQDETFTVSLVSPGVNLSPSNATVTVVDDDGQEISIGFDRTSYTVSESDGVVELAISIVGSVSESFSISYGTLDGTAVGALNGGDYQQKSETVTVSPTDSQVDITVQVHVDSILENDEHFSVLITSSAGSVTVDPSTAQVTIVDTSIVEVEFEHGEYSVQESSGSVEVCLVLDGMTQFPVDFQMTSLESTPRDAEGGADFMTATIDAVLQPLTSRVCAEFTVFNDNLAEAQTETFAVTFSTGDSLLQIGNRHRATISIVDSYGGGLYFMLNGQRIPYNSDTEVDIRDIGIGGAALLCVTDRAGCCTGAGRTGEWYYPDGQRVNIQSAGDNFYRNRGDRIVRLNRAGSALEPTGRYRCEVPDANGVTQNIYIRITA